MCYPNQIYLLLKTIPEDGDASTRGIILKRSVWRSWYLDGLYFRMCEPFGPLSWQSPTAPTHTPTRFVSLSSFVVAWFGCQFFGLVLSFLRCLTSLHPLSGPSRGWRICAGLFVSWVRQSSRCCYSLIRTCYLGPFQFSFFSGSFMLACFSSTLSPFVKRKSLYTLHHDPVYLSVLILHYSLPLFLIASRLQEMWKLMI